MKAGAAWVRGGRMAGVLAALAGLFVVSAQLHCSVAFEQCSRDVECDPVLGVAAGNALCDLGTCKLKQQAPVSQDAAPTPCKTNEDCVAKSFNGNPGLCLTPGTASCVPLTSAECPEVSANWKDTLPGVPPVIIGYLNARTIRLGDGATVNNSSQSVNVDGLNLASEIWAAKSSGGMSVSGQKQPIVHIICETGLEKTKALNALAHVQGAGAKAVLVHSAIDALWVGKAAADKQTLVLCTDCPANTVPIADAAGLVWYLRPTLDSMGKVMALGASQVESMLRGRSMLNRADGKMKVAVITHGNAAYLRYTDALEAELSFNGSAAKSQSIVDRPADPLYLRINTVDEFTGTIDYAAEVKKLVEFAPDVILTNVGGAFGFQYFYEIEAQFPAGAKHKPYYVLGEDESLSLTDESFLPYRSRLLGLQITHPPETKDNYREYVNMFAQRYQYLPSIVYSAYEGYFALANLWAATLSRTTVQPTQIDGTKLADAFSRLRPPGTGSGRPVINHVKEDIDKGLTFLKEGRDIDLMGIASTLDWDATNGSVSQTTGLFCMQPGNVSEPVRFVDAGIRSDGVTYTAALDVAACEF